MKNTIEREPEFDWEGENESIDLRKLLSRIRINWHWSVLFAFLALALAVTWLYFTAPTYETRSMILIKEEQSKSGNGGLFKGNMELLQGLGIVSGVSNVDNELEILKSYSLMNQVVQDLALNLRFYTEGKPLTTDELYGSTLPFRLTQQITDISRYNSLNGKAFKVTLHKTGGFLMEDVEGGKKYPGKLGVPLELPGIHLLLENNPLVTKWNKPLTLKIFNLDGTTIAYSRRFDAEIPTKQVSIVNLKIKDNIPERGQQVLSQMVRFFIANSIADRNTVSDSTIAFINSRLASATDDLSQVESRIQNFKQSNNIVDIPTQAQALITNAGAMSKSEADKEVQLSMVNSLITFMQQTGNNPKLVPAALMVDNAVLNPVIDKYNTLLLERERNLMSVTEDNPIIRNIDQQLTGLRANMMSGLHSMQVSTQSGLNSLRRSSGGISSNIGAVPAKEKQFLEFSRQQSIKQELYVFLLQKREEAGLAKSSNMPNARVIDGARTDPGPVSPKAKLILVGSLLLGLLTPLFWSWLKEMVNNRINMKEDIEKRTKAPIIGEISHAKSIKYGTLKVTLKSRDAVSEQFRILRSNLNYVLTGAKDKVILVTSSIPGEGKTFVSLNLAATLALGNKKVVVLGMDLRKPKLSKLLGLSDAKGISNYLIGSCSLEDIIFHVEDHENLFAIPSGPVPPNPSEILMLPQMQDLIEELRYRFDYIIIDTAPIVVTDATILSKHADVTLFITRPMLTYKDSIKNIDQLFRTGRLPRINVIVNDINVRKSPYYGYGNYYYYGYYESGTREKRKKQKKGSELVV